MQGRNARNWGWLSVLMFPVVFSTSFHLFRLLKLLLLIPCINSPKSHCHCNTYVHHHCSTDVHHHYNTYVRLHCSTGVHCHAVQMYTITAVQLYTITAVQLCTITTVQLLPIAYYHYSADATVESY